VIAVRAEPSDGEASGEMIGAVRAEPSDGEASGEMIGAVRAEPSRAWRCEVRPSAGRAER